MTNGSLSLLILIFLFPAMTFALEGDSGSILVRFNYSDG